MSGLEFYFLFAITTGFVSIYELVVPVMRDLEQQTNNYILEHKYIAYLTFFGICTLFAPVYLIICLVPAMGDRYRETILKDFLKQD